MMNLNLSFGPGARLSNTGRATQGVPSAILYTNTIEGAWLIFVVQIFNNPLRSDQQVNTLQLVTTIHDDSFEHFTRDKQRR